MAKALLVELSKDLNDILSLNLPLYLGFEIIQKDSVEDAIQMLEIFPDISVIIAPDKGETGNVAQAIDNHLDSAELDIPLLI